MVPVVILIWVATAYLSMENQMFRDVNQDTDSMQQSLLDIYFTLSKTTSLHAISSLSVTSELPLPSFDMVGLWKAIH